MTTRPTTITPAPGTPGQSAASGTSAASPRIPPGTARRVRLHVSAPSPCNLCTAACCKQNGHDYAALLRGGELRKFAAFAVDVPIRGADGRVVVERVLPYVDGRCQFLGEDDRCTIYEDRPQACRAFECVDAFNAEGVGRHGPFLTLNPGVRELLEAM